MKSKVIKTITIIFITIIIATIFLAITSKCQAIVDVTQDPDFWKPKEETVQNERIGTILGIITVIGVFVSVISLSILGIKFMTGSVEQKAGYKQALLPWSVGAVLVFSLTTIPTIIYNMTSDINTVEEVQISLDKTDVTLKIGEIDQVTLYATIMSETSKIVTWTTSNSRVATVDSRGNVTAKGTGTAVIKASIGQSEASCRVIVESVLTSNITISQNSLVLDAPITNSHKLTATVTPYNSTEPINWTSSDINVATVSSSGKVIATGKGTATITAKSGTKSATCTVQVNSERVYNRQYYDVSKNKVSSSKPSGDYIEFLLYIPDVSYVKNVSKLPLIVYLHGGQLTSANNMKSSNPFELQDVNTNYGAICIFPVSPYEEGKLGWAQETNERMENLKKLIDYSIENYNVDSDKIALTGFSNGGIGTWKIGVKYPTLFSCLVPVSGYSPRAENVYPDCPVWAICSSGDGTSSYAERLGELLRNAGKQVKVDNRGNIPHQDMGDEAYTPDLINWMIQRSRATNDKFRF